MNLPNKLSLTRIILVPFILLFMLPIHIGSFCPEGWNEFVCENGMIVAAILFVIASLTDLFDGKIARKYNLITNLGKFLDPLGDKMLVISVLIALVDLNRISAIWVCIIVLREFAVTGIRMLASAKGVVMAAKMIGKIKTVTQMVAISYLMFETALIKIFHAANDSWNVADIADNVQLVGNILLIISVIMTIISGLDYILKNLDLLKEDK